MAKVDLAKAKEMADEASQGLFFKWEDGTKALVVFQFLNPKTKEEVVDAEETVWIEKLGRSETFDPAKHGGQAKGVSYTFCHFLMKYTEDDEKSWKEINTHKLSSLNAKWFKVMLAAVNKYADKFGGRDQVVFEVERKGEKGKTNYTFLPEGSIKDFAGLAEMISKSEWKDPTSKESKEEGPKKSSNGSSASNGDNGATLLSPDDANALMQRIKALPDPREKAAKFCEKFGIGKIRDLKKSDHVAAIDYLKSLEPKPAGAAADPFAD